MSGPKETPIALRARWVLPVDREPIERGVVTIAGGQIVAVGSQTAGPPPRDLGEVALLPGLVNAHTHLEFSLLDPPLGEAGMLFPEWVAKVIDWRATARQSEGCEQDPFWRRTATIVLGLDDSRAAGVVALGEIAQADLPVEEYAWEPQVTTRLFVELLGLASARVEPLMQAARSYLDAFKNTADFLRPGLSPHAPYTVHPELLSRVCALSAAERVPVAMHLAESREEMELLRTQSGKLVEFLNSLGAWHPGVLPWELRPMDYLTTLAKAHHALVIHGNYLLQDEIDFIADHRERMTVVYCPRTHAYFRHAPYPLARMLAAGVRVAVGTDSRASNPNLNLFEELQFIARTNSDVSPAEILRMGTLRGAEALGLAGELGSITPGKRAALIAVRLSHVSESPYEELFDGQPRTLDVHAFAGGQLSTEY